MSSLDQARALLQGSYDLHIHPIPSHVPRLLDDFEVLAQAEEAGMAGVLLKNHYEPTGARAILANRRGEGFRAKAYGAAVLNWPLGGLNPYAVHSALKMGAHVIFMPTRDAANCLFHGDMPGDFSSGRASAYWISRGICAGKSTRSSKWSGVIGPCWLPAISAPWNPSCSAGRAAGWG